MRSKTKITFNILIICTCSMAVTGAGLIKNPGFEQGTSGWTHPVNNGYYINKITSEEKYSGKYSFYTEVLNWPNPGWVGIRSDAFPVSPNTGYILTFKAKGENISGGRGFNVHIREQDKNAKAKRIFWAIEKNKYGSFPWKTFTKQFKTGPDTVKITIVEAILIQKGKIWIDDFKLVKQNTAKIQKPKTAALQKRENIIYAQSDKGYNSGRYAGTTHQGHVREKIKKNLDLSNITQKDWDKLPNASISFLGYCADNKNNGITESIDITVNNHLYRYKLNSHLPVNYENIAWRDFPIDKKALKRSLNVITIGKSSGTKDGDDFFYIGINSREKNNCSYYSTDNGKNWQKNLNNFKTRGEYMVRLKLYNNEIKRKIVPEEINLLPSVKNISNPITATSPLYNRTDDKLTIENAFLKVCFYIAGKKLKLFSLTNKYTNSTPVRTNSPVQLFKITKNNQNLSLKDFSLENILVNKEKDTIIVDFLLKEEADKIHGINVALKVSLARSQELELALKLSNPSPSPVESIVAFPVLHGIKWNENVDDDFYLFPASGGTISKTTCANATTYGGAHSAFYQLLASYSPSVGGGLYLMSKDNSGIFKIIGCNKNSVESLAEGELSKGEIGGSLSIPFLNYVYSELFSSSIGTSFTIMHQAQKIGGGKSLILPPATIGVMKGDWHVAMQRYREWFEKNRYKHKKRGRLDGHFNAFGTWLYKGRYSEPLDPRVQVPELYAWWEWIKLTPEFVKENANLAHEADQKWSPWDGRQGTEDGTRYFFGHCGDYGREGGYNRRWGGLAALRKYIKKLQKENRLVGLYTEGVLADIPTGVGRKYGKMWGLIKEDGTYLWDYGMWNMCMDNPLWREYLAETAAFIIKETGCNGIRFDQFGHVGWRCFSKKHEHTFSKNHDNVWLRAEADVCRRARIKLDKIDPNAFVMTEYFGYDYLAQYADGCLSYLLSKNLNTGRLFINLSRFYFPGCKQFEHYYGNDPNAEKLLLFNGMGWSGRMYTLSNMRMLMENSDAFDSEILKPLIKTLIPKVYANYFKSGRKTIYTVYNASGESQEGYTLEIPLDTGQHIFDIYRQKEIALKRKKTDKALLSLRLKAGELACPTVFKKWLTIDKSKQKIIVKNNIDIQGTLISISDKNNKKLLETKEKKLKIPDNVLKNHNTICAKVIKDNKVLDVIKIK